MIPAFGTGDDLIEGVLNNYVWDGDIYAAHFEASHVDGFSPGILAAVNGHMKENNVELRRLKYDMAGMKREKDEGCGAITPFHSVEVETTRDIDAGGELFLVYGNEWFTLRGYSTKSPPGATETIETIDKLVKAFQAMTTKWDGKSDIVKDKTWAFIRNEFLDSTLQQSLPETSQELANFTTPKTVPHPYKHPISFLLKNGLCLDNLRPGVSPIPQAGRGAFATRFLPKGSVIAPSPLIHIIDRNEVRETYHLFSKENPDRDLGGLPETQILLNYCFGHRSTTLLLCPYGAKVALINHSNEPNARIVWSSMPTFERNWLNMTVGQLEEIDNVARLAFDVVALRDITPDEEVLIDYGEEWVAAWEKHVREWSPPADATEYIPPGEFNKTELVVRTTTEQVEYPYPRHLRTICFVDYEEDEPETIQWEIEEEELEIIKWEIEDYKNHMQLYNMRSCVITNRWVTENTTLYKAQLKVDPAFFKEDFDVPLHKKVFVTNMPREAITFLDYPYLSDIHLKGAFRHEIMIPDDIFPSAWKMGP